MVRLDGVVEETARFGDGALNIGPAFRVDRALAQGELDPIDLLLIVSSALDLGAEEAAEGFGFERVEILCAHKGEALESIGDLAITHALPWTDPLEAQLEDATAVCEAAHSDLLSIGVHLSLGVIPLLSDVRNRGVDLPARIQRSLRDAIAKTCEDAERVEALYQRTKAICREHKLGPYEAETKAERSFGGGDAQ